MIDNALLEDLRQRIIYQFADFLILEELKTAVKPKSGRHLINHINRTFEVSIDDGLVFSLLLMMERKGLIRGHSKETHGRTRRFYKITETGKNLLANYLNCRDDIISFMRILLRQISR